MWQCECRLARVTAGKTASASQQQQVAEVAARNCHVGPPCPAAAVKLQTHALRFVLNKLSSCLELSLRCSCYIQETRGRMPCTPHAVQHLTKYAECQTRFLPLPLPLPCLQDHLLPEEYVVTMRQHMLDKCPVSAWPEVAQIIREDLGQPPEVLFKEFSTTPIASASLAQVGCLLPRHADSSRS